VNAEEIRPGHRLGTEEAYSFHLGHAVGHELKLLHGHGVVANGGGLTGMMESFDHVWVGGIKGIGVSPSG